jgi:hydroxypyruvate isomerase
MLNFCANLSLLFTEHELADRFHAAKHNGFKAVEIQFPYSLDAQAIKDKLQENALKLVLFNVAADDLLQGGEGLAGVPEQRGAFRAALAQAVAYARVLSPEAVNVLPGRCLQPERLADYLQTFKDNLRLAADTFAELGVKTVFEAINTDDMPDFIIHSGAQMLAVADELQHPNVFMQVDCYHLHKMGGDAADFIARHADKIGHIQFADCPRRGQPGTGRIDFERLFAAIEQSAYSGWVGAEYKPVGTTAESLAWLRR